MTKRISSPDFRIVKAEAAEARARDLLAEADRGGNALDHPDDLRLLAGRSLAFADWARGMVRDFPRTSPKTSPNIR